MLDVQPSQAEPSHARPSLVSLPSVEAPPRPGRGVERVAAALYALSFVAITATVASASVNMWHDAHRNPTEAQAVTPAFATGGAAAALSAAAPYAHAKAAYDADCSDAREVPGATLVQCPGWMTIVDDRDGTTTVEARAVGLAQLSPPVLLRADGTLATWSPEHRRFDAGRKLLDDSLATSAVLRDGKLLTRESRTSDTLAYACGATCRAIRAGFVYADDQPLTLDCGAGVPPRFQLVVLAPRMGDAYDGEVARQRVLGLLDVERGTLAWTSEPLRPLRVVTACRDGRYTAELELGTRTVTWTIDAETGAREVR